MVKVHLELHKEPLSGFKGDLEKLKQLREYRPVEKAFEDILKGYDIYFQQHYTMTLVGEHCHRLAVHHEDILAATQDAMLEGLRTGLTNPNQSQAKPTGTEDEIILMMENMRELMEVLDYISSVITRMTTASAKDLERFPFACQYFGAIWRLYGMSPTPKLHMLEAHFPSYLLLYGRLGIFGEDPIERLHALNNKWYRVFASVKIWEDQAKLIHSRIHLPQHSAVSSAISIVQANTERHFSDETQQIKRQKVDANISVKDEKYEKASAGLKRKFDAIGDQINDDGSLKGDVEELDSTAEYTV